MIQQDEVIIVGGGIVGVSTAIWLQRSGFKVTIIDQTGFAAETSHGNAGVLASSSVIPVTVPGILPKIPGMLLGKDKPLFLRWSYLPRLFPFLLRYFSYANKRDLKRIASGLAILMHDSADQHFALARGTPAEVYLKSADFVHAFTSQKSFEMDADSWTLKSSLGFEFDRMDETETAQYDPLFAGRFGYAIRCPDHGQITDPGAYTRALGQHFLSSGGVLEIAAVEEIITENGKAMGVRTNRGDINAAHVVVAAGAWSSQMLKKLDTKVPMESERGYHVEFVNPNIHLRSPTMVTSGKFVMNSMQGRLRCAGVAEFGGLEAGPSQKPVAFLKRQVASLFPDLEYEETRSWMGHRPSTVDSMPFIGSLERFPNVWAGFGHQHLGLTGAAKTGRWLAQMIGKETPNADLSHFSPDRFS